MSATTDLDTAERLMDCVKLLHQHALCLRGDEEDLTGVGLWRMFCQNLERAKQCRVITEEQWQGFLDLQRRVSGDAR